MIVLQTTHPSIHPSVNQNRGGREAWPRWHRIQQEGLGGSYATNKAKIERGFAGSPNRNKLYPDLLQVPASLFSPSRNSREMDFWGKSASSPFPRPQIGRYPAPDPSAVPPRSGSLSMKRQRGFSRCPSERKKADHVTNLRIRLAACEVPHWFRFSDHTNQSAALLPCPP